MCSVWQNQYRSGIHRNSNAVNDAAFRLFPAALHPAVQAVIAGLGIRQTSTGDRCQNKFILTIGADTADSIKEPLAHRTGRIVVVTDIAFPGFPNGGCALIDLVQPARLLFVFQHFIGKVSPTHLGQSPQHEGCGQETGTDTVIPVFHSLGKTVCYCGLGFTLSNTKSQGPDQLCLPVGIRSAALQEQMVIGFLGTLCIFPEQGCIFSLSNYLPFLARIAANTSNRGLPFTRTSSFNHATGAPLTPIKFIKYSSLKRLS